MRSVACFESCCSRERSSGYDVGEMVPVAIPNSVWQVGLEGRHWGKAAGG
jgi:hypothetical protein